MTEPTGAPLKKTSLHAAHVALGARMVPFAGWEMPVEYSGITAEHLAVRSGAGLFDVSHMGEIEIAGKDALAAVQHISSNDASRLQVNQAHYSALTTPQGTFVDDMLVYRFAPNHFLLVVNGSNADKDYVWIADRVKEVGDAAVVNSSDRYALIAIQGPKARGILQSLTAIDLSAIRYYWFAHGEVAGIRGTVSRTGYTGEDGYEVFVAPGMAPRLWEALLNGGRAEGLIPCGLGARDTLRLEAAMRLYGNDIDDTTTVLEADLNWIIGWKKESFVGHEALRQQKESGVTRRIVGFVMVDRAIARHGHLVMQGTEQVGYVTSGTQTPFLKKAIGMAYVPTHMTAPGTDLDIDIRGRRAKAIVVELPFYKRPKSA
jgi:aminomethyltransferase